MIRHARYGIWVCLLVISSPAIAQDASTFSLKLVTTNGDPVANTQIQFRVHPNASNVTAKKGKLLPGGKNSFAVVSDAEGKIDLQLPSNAYYLEFKVSADGYGPYIGRWDIEKSGTPFPKSFTATLETTWSIGGIVVDEDGKPIPRVEVDPSIDYKRRPGDPRHLGTNIRTATDLQGKWRIDRVPESMDSVFFQFKHRELKPNRLRLSRSDYGLDANEEPTAKVVMTRGLQITGRVTDLKGEPVKGATVRTKFLNDRRSAITDENGEYVLHGCEERNARVVVNAKSYALELADVRVQPKMDPVDFQLSPGGHVRIRVVDSQGNGLPKARVFFQQWRNNKHFFEFENVNQYTNAEGIWEWNEAPVDAFEADICHPDGMQISDQKIIAREEEYVFVPPPHLIVSGLVIDAESKKMVPNFRVVPGVQHKEGDPIRWLNDDAKSNDNGRYSLRHHYEKSFAHLIRVEAEGFLPKVSRNIASDEGDVTLHFKLDRGADVAATVTNAAGQPVGNATVVLCAANTQLNIKNGHVDERSTFDALQSKTNQNGRFKFASQAAPFHLFVLADDGYAHHALKPGDATPPIQLIKWAGVTGKYQVGEEPAVAQPLSGSSNALDFHGDDVPNVSWQYSTRTDDQGQFRFARVPVGYFGVRREIIRMVGDGATEVASTPIVTVDAVSGETTKLQLGGKGAKLVCKLRAPANVKEIDWRQASIFIGVRPPTFAPLPIPPEAEEDDEKAQAWLQEWYKTAAGKKWKANYLAIQESHEKGMKFYATVDDNGKFSVDDVPVGDYEVTCHVRFKERMVHGVNSFSVTEEQSNERATIELDAWQLH